MSRPTFISGFIKGFVIGCAVLGIPVGLIEWVGLGEWIPAILWFMVAGEASVSIKARVWEAYERKGGWWNR